MRILFLATDAYGSNGGIAKFNRDLIEAICSIGDVTELTVLTRSRCDFDRKILSKKIRYLEPVGKVSYALQALQEMVFGCKYDFLICGHINILPLIDVLLMAQKTKIVLIIHGIDAWKKPRNFSKKALSKVSNVISVSDFTKNRFITWSSFKGSLFILPNCVDLNKIHPGPARGDLVEKYNLKGKKVIMTLARLVGQERYKGIDEVIEAMPKLKEKIPNLVYLVCGGGEDRARLEEKAEKLNLKNEITFTGFVSESEKLDYFRLADAFVMPGRGEGFGIVYLEALACGVPVVGSQLDGSREALLDGELGTLVDPRNQIELVEGILKALSHPKGSTPERLEYFSYEIFQKRVQNIFSQLLRKNGIKDSAGSSFFKYILLAFFPVAELFVMSLVGLTHLLNYQNFLFLSPVGWVLFQSIQHDLSLRLQKFIFSVNLLALTAYLILSLRGGIYFPYLSYMRSDFLVQSFIVLSSCFIFIDVVNLVFALKNLKGRLFFWVVIIIFLLFPYRLNAVLWPILSALTTAFSYQILSRLLGYPMIAAVDPYTLNHPLLRANIFAPCSGFEGVSFILIALSCLFLLDSKSRSGISIVLIFLFGMIYMFLLNVLRIVLFFAAGIWAVKRWGHDKGATVFINLFHRHVGWSVYAIGITLFLAIFLLNDRKKAIS